MVEMRSVWFAGLFGLFLLSAVGGFFLVDRFFVVPGIPTEYNKQKTQVKQTGIPEVPVMIVPHHLMAKQAIEETFSEVVSKELGDPVSRVVIVSPNHFNRGNGWAVSSKREWKTDEGVVQADEKFIDSLGGDVFVRDDVLDLEHGVYGIAPFIARHFPEAKIVPLAIYDGIPEAKIDVLLGHLMRDTTGTLLILSADFSHYLDKNLSRLHDEKTLQVIQNFEYKSVHTVDIDCAPGLALVLRYADHIGVKDFHLVRHSSSSTITGKNMIGQETSHIAGYFSQNTINEKKNEHSIFLLFAGDAMFDRDVRGIAQKNGVDWITEDIRRVFLAQDANILNLEGPVTRHPSVSIGTKMGSAENYRFTFDPDVTSAFLLSNRFNVVSIGNNHTMNFGDSGLTETKEFLKKEGVSFFRDPSDETGMVYKTVLGGKKIAFVNYNQFGSFGWEKTVDKIREEHTLGSTVIVYCHWGVEYALRESNGQREKARAFIDAGAETIIGSHPHVVQPIEIYKGKAIFYSLGNFVFDQYFSEDTLEGLLLGLEIDEDQSRFVLSPIRTGKDGKVRFLSDPDRQKMLDRIAYDAIADEDVRVHIRDGMFSL